MQIRPNSGISRRDLLVVADAALVTILGVVGTERCVRFTDTQPEFRTCRGHQGVLRRQRASRTLELDTRTTLLDALREHLHLTGTKKGCDHGQCGACTVIVDGRRINSCLTLAVMHEGDSITTIEGLGTPGPPAPDAGGIREARRLPMRLLHARADLLGRRGARRDQGRHPEPRER